MPDFSGMLKKFAPYLMGLGFGTALVSLFVMAAVMKDNPDGRNICMSIGTSGFVVYVLGRIGLSARRKDERRQMESNNNEEDDEN